MHRHLRALAGDPGIHRRGVGDVQAAGLIGGARGAQAPARMGGAQGLDQAAARRSRPRR
ncbi:MAG: hypothetical protein WDN45_17315 [Caulobacteraceae bacterium]